MNPRKVNTLGFGHMFVHSLADESISTINKPEGNVLGVVETPY
jgi:hypothetical protein